MSANKIPVIVLTGFLGSGKTTLLNRLLTDDIKTALIINEFGNTPIDQDLIDNQALPMTVLAGGCLCCQIKHALAPCLKNLWMAWHNAATKPFHRIIIETSGVASPEPVLDTLLRDTWISQRYQLTHVLTTLAIPYALEQLQHYPEAQAQVSWADTLILTHSDIANANQIKALTEQLILLAPTTPTIYADLTGINGNGLTTPATLRRLPNDVTPEHHFYSVSLHLEHRVDLNSICALLSHLFSQYPNELIRIKGVLHSTTYDHPVSLHAANGYLYPLTHLPNRPNLDQRSRLILITTTNPETIANELILALKPARNAVRLH